MLEALAASTSTSHDALPPPAGAPAPPAVRLSRSTSAASLGRRTAELHAAFADADRRPRLRRRADRRDRDMTRWTSAATREVDARARHRRGARAGPAGEAQADVAALLEGAEGDPASVSRARPRCRPRACKTAHPRRLPSRPGAGGPGRRRPSSTSRASRSAASPSGARRPRRCATSPACCAPSTTPRGRRSTGCATAPARSTRRIRDRAFAWRDAAARDFLAAYLAAAAGAGFLPDDRSSPQALLDLFLLQKAFYEIAVRGGQPAGLALDPDPGRCSTSSGGRVAGMGEGLRRATRSKNAIVVPHAVQRGAGAPQMRDLVRLCKPRLRLDKRRFRVCSAPFHAALRPERHRRYLEAWGRRSRGPRSSSRGNLSPAHSRASGNPSLIKATIGSVKAACPLGRA